MNSTVKAGHFLNVGQFFFFRTSRHLNSGWVPPVSSHFTFFNWKLQGIKTENSTPGRWLPLFAIFWQQICNKAICRLFSDQIINVSVKSARKSHNPIFNSFFGAFISTYMADGIERLCRWYPEILYTEILAPSLTLPNIKSQFTLDSCSWSLFLSMNFIDCYREP